MWLQRIIAGLRGDFPAAMLLGQTTMVIQALDLGLIVPLALFTGWALWRGKTVGYLLSTKAVAMAAAICAMLLFVWLAEGTLEAAPLVIFGGALVASAYLGVRIYRSIPGSTLHD